MNAPDTGSPQLPNPQVRTLLLTDLCDSTMLVERLGDKDAAELFRAHDRLVLKLQQQWHGRLIDRSDGLLLLFERPIDGLGFAMDYVRGLRELGEQHKVARHGVELQARSGLHVGEVLTWRNSDAAVNVGAKPLEVEGLAKPMAGRLMTLARPGQILLSATAEPLAHRAARELGERGEHLLWKSHGRWRFKGVPQIQEIYEVGEPGIAPLRAPQQNRSKAWRDIPLWRRPAALAAELVLVAGLAGGAWFMTKPQPAIAFAERDWVVVADLRNLTGDAMLDESLEQAFRISLEQSRYVNVLSDLKARDTLERMRRKPGTVLDRAIASEIALRDGARAVILPTVAEVGGRVRVSAEVVDPHTQTTVYAASADGSGVGSTLGSIDKVTGELRGKLGEALESIQKTSVSLPNVTTSNLDALKAYALAQNLVERGQKKEALAFYQRAISLDKGFALAWLKLGRALETIGGLGDAATYYETALKLRTHLPAREALVLDAQVASRHAPATAIQHWREAVALYPDFHDAQFSLALDGMNYANLYEDSLPHAHAATARQSTIQGRSSYLEGMILLGLERYAEAIVAFRKSRTLGYSGAGVAYAYAFAAQRDYAGAAKIIGERRDTGFPVAELELIEYKTYIALDRGMLDQAQKNALEGLAAAERTGAPIAVAEWIARKLAVDVIAEAGSRADLQAEVMAEVARINSEREALDGDYPAISSYLLLGVGYIGARTDSQAAVEEALKLVSDSDVAAAPVLQQMRRVLEAEAQRMSGRPAAAIQMLQPLSGQREAIFAVHSALHRAATEAGNRTLALEQARWMVAHRGRAFVEAGTDGIETPFSIADTAIAP